jgi:hypothetical protein
MEGAVVNKYRFLASNVPNAYAVFHADTMTRVPGLVSRDPGNGQLTFQRERTVDGKRVVDSLSADRVADMSRIIHNYFSGTPED